MLNELLSSVLNGAVGNNMNNDPNDVLSVKNGLSRAGYMDLDTTPEPHGYYTRDLDNGIKAFQRDNDLRIDGRLFPKGETERELFTPPIPQRKPQHPTQSKVKHTIDTFLPKIFKDEGGYTDGKSSPNAIDPLGKTNFGIPRQTLVEYENFKKSKKEPLPSTYTKDVKKVSPKLAAQIYDEMYYKRYNIDKIQDENLAGHLLDITINPGPARAGRWLQEELNNHLGTN